MNRKTLVIFAGVAMFIALAALILAPAPQMAYAQNPTPAPQPPVAVLKVVAVPANPALPGAITGTLTYITDTAVGAAKTTAAMGTTGLSDVPINVPVRLEVSAADPKNTGKPTWSLTKPSDSKAAIKDPTAMTTEFTPDVVGAYMVGVSLKNDAGATSNSEFAFFNAGTFIGVTAGNCKNCHPDKTAEWAKTGHAKILTDEIDNSLTPDVPTHYSESCIRCHTTGWYLPPIGVGSGGFNDAKSAANWTFPTFAQIDAAGKKTGPSNWDAMPASVQNMANIQCEQCHGPANEHVKDSAKVMAVSYDNGVCDVCHAGGGHHIKGLEIQYSAHSDATAAAWTTPTGPEEQACVRCHTSRGYASFVKNPTNPAAWDNTAQTLGCSGCHDPHSDANFAQLRVVGKPVQVPFEAKDVGLSATCEECHNNRTDPANAPKNSYPHYSSAAEMLTDTGGVTYGQTVPNSPHAMVVGTSPMPDPSDSTGQTKLFGGNVPGPCVACHMYPGLTDAKDPNYMKVGSHSFNTVSPDGTLDYGAACKSCHGDVKSFNMPAKADYDGNGKTEGVQDETKGLLNVLWTDLEAKGLKKVATGYPYATVPSDADEHVKNAWYNFRYVYGVMWGTATGDGNQGMAASVHNFKRSCALLQLSIKDLTGSLPTGATDCTK
jgi:Cytochrome c554 and c-prime